MIIAQIEGGLGSQMWGYAAARRLALSLGTDVYIDTRNYRTYTKFKPELHHFDVEAYLLDDAHADEICGTQNERVRVVAPAHLHMDRSILEITDFPVLMVGNYISEDYFGDVKDLVRREFRRITDPDEHGVAGRRAVDEIRSNGFAPVSLHVRHGDYVNEEHITKVHGVCTEEYYEHAIELMRKLVPNAWFVLFSDDTAWLERSFALSNQTIIPASPGSAPVEDMQLMSACDHHILANSTYSWWGAWLGHNHSKHVIGPRPLLADRSLNTEDMLLRDWISLGMTPRPTYRPLAARGALA